MCGECGTYLSGSRWKWCSQQCGHRYTTRKRRIIAGKVELEEMKRNARMEQVKVNSSKEAYELIKTMV